MTVRQLHYTSCEDGLEGIQGFQLSAITPGAPGALTDLAVRASAYEAGPGLAEYLDDSELSRFPIAFGFLPSGGGAALFESRYTGTDFTGRVGNYFAHALLLDNAEEELSGMLPIDLWRSPAWSGTRQDRGAVLPVLPRLLPGAAADRASTQRFLARPGHLDRLAELMDAVQRALSTNRGRLILVVPDDDAAALWLAAVCRSLPRPISLRVSFVTYTARPDDQEVLVSCVTPDVALPAYGDFTVLDLTGEATGRDASRYASAVVRAWRRGEAGRAMRLAEQATPELSLGELEAFGTFVDLAMDLPSAGAAEPVEERHLLDAVGLAVDRLAGSFGRDAWQQVCDRLRDLGGPLEVGRWSTLLRTAQHRDEPLPPALLALYYAAVIVSPDHAEPAWLPALTAADLDGIAENVALPVVTNGQPVPQALPHHLARQPDLLAALIRVLDRRLRDERQLVRLAAALAPAVAELVRDGSGSNGGRTALLGDLVLARAGMADRVAVLAAATAAGSRDGVQLAQLLWPQPPSANEAGQILRQLPPDVLTATGLAARIAGQLVAAGGSGPPTAGELRLVDLLLGSPAGVTLPGRHRTALQGLQLTGHFRQTSPKRAGGRDLARALDVAGKCPPAIAHRLLDSIAASLLGVDDPKTHSDLLGVAVSAHSGFLSSYREMAIGHLRNAPAKQVASTIVLWHALADARTRHELLERTLPAALSRRGGRYLDRIGTALDAAAKRLGQPAPRRAAGWAPWWRAWRASHERRWLTRILRRLLDGRR